MKTAVLFLVFNRPDTTEQVFRAIAEARPERLYVAADGPRADRDGEAERCAEVRRIATGVDWDCEVKTLFRDENLGCRLAVSGGIDWFFEHEEEGIILEDDCLPDQSFFPYCTELLERYRDDKRVMCITGDRSFPENTNQKEDYLFSALPLIWGWATWRRAWQSYDFGKFSTIDFTQVVRSISCNKQFVSARCSLYEKVASKEVDTWDAVWGAMIWTQGGLTCIPRVNLISNIGFIGGATHTTEENSPRDNYPSRPLLQPLQHPTFAVRDVCLDRDILEHVHYIKPVEPLVKRILGRVRFKLSKLMK